MRNFAKRTLSLCLLLSVMLSVCAFAEPAVVSGSDVNVRSGPGTGYTVIDCLAWGTNVEILDRSNSSWYKISFNGNTGYIYSSFLKITGSSSGSAVESSGSTQTGNRTGSINAMYVNVRSGPGSDYPVIGTFNSGTALTITGESGSWYSIVINGSSGYVFKQYVTVGSASSSQTAVVTPAPEPSSSGSTVNTGYINASNVNMRSGPASTYPVVDCLARSTSVTITGSAVNSWTPVQVNGNSGYVFSQYVTAAASSSNSGSQIPAVTPAPEPAAAVVTPTPSPSVTPAPEPGVGDTTAYVTGDGVSFRSGPGTGYSIIATYDRGKQVIVKGTSGAWSNVVVDSRDGYIYSSYLSSTNPNSTAAQTPAPTDTPTPAPETPVVTPTPTPAPTAGSNSGYINAQSVNMRSGPGSSYQVIACLDQGTQLAITATSGAWYGVTVNGTAGYVYSQYVTRNSSSGTTAAVTPAPSSSTTGTEGYISGNSVHFRSGPGSGYSVLGTYNYGKTLIVVGSSGDWTNCVIDGVNGYVYKTYVSTGSTAGSTTGNTGTSTTPAPSGNNGTVTGQDVASFALQFVGSRYVWGGSDPSGFDCSGLVKYCYEHFGYTVHRVACDQAGDGIYVDNSSISNLQPGDILCFYSGANYIGHVGIYIGNGQFVHASTSTTGVIISTLDGWYTSRGYIARRIIY